MIQVLVKFAIFLPVIPFLLFYSAQRADWGMGWIYVGLFMTATVTNTLLMARNDPDLLRERNQIKQDAKFWDQVLSRLIALGPLIMLIVAGLDKRFVWSPPVSLVIQIIALVTAVAGYLLSTWAMLSNRFYSAVVRIQKDRSHTAISVGPYRVIRHPGYAGGIILFLATPLILSSFWAFLTAGFATCVVIIRTAFEDKTLQRELHGYQEYANQVRYRLLPGIW